MKRGILRVTAALCGAAVAVTMFAAAALGANITDPGNTDIYGYWSIGDSPDTACGQGSKHVTIVTKTLFFSYGSDGFGDQPTMQMFFLSAEPKSTVSNGMGHWLLQASDGPPRSYFMAYGKLNGLAFRCDTVPAPAMMAYGEAVSLIGALDEVADACRSDDTRKCLQAIINAGDVSRDGKLGKAELVRVLRAVSFFGGYLAAASNADAVPVDVATSGMLAAAAFGPTVAQTLIDGSDYNGDGFLDVDELMVDRPGDGVLAIFGAVRAGAIQGSAQSIIALLSGLVPKMVNGLL